MCFGVHTIGNGGKLFVRSALSLIIVCQQADSSALDAVFMIHEQR